MIVAGVGCRKGAAVADVTAAIRAALMQAGRSADALSMIATSQAKAAERAISIAASALGRPLILVAQADLEAQSHRTATKSARSLAVTGVPSLAEAAALAAGGPAARLIGARVAVGTATCALAEAGAEP